MVKKGGTAVPSCPRSPVPGAKSRPVGRRPADSWPRWPRGWQSLAGKTESVRGDCLQRWLSPWSPSVPPLLHPSGIRRAATAAGDSHQQPSEGCSLVAKGPQIIRKQNNALAGSRGAHVKRASWVHHPLPGFFPCAPLGPHPGCCLPLFNEEQCTVADSRGGEDAHTSRVLITTLSPGLRWVLCCPGELQAFLLVPMAIPNRKARCREMEEPPPMPSVRTWVSLFPLLLGH